MPGRDVDKAEIKKREKEMLERLISRVEELRQKNAMTLKFLGDSSQLGQGYITQLLQGKRDPKLSTIVKLAYALDVEERDLLADGPKLRPKPKRGRPKLRRATK